ncbi:hypothetical protein EXS72_02195 [Candidatus Pacearchaeota archaeon]|nr:hypothetical protein [Candidatus Pacearchaeota archaeon]
MPIFSRGKGDVLDLPDLNRRGLFKFPEVKNEEEEIDFTKSPQNNLNVEITAQETNLNKEISSNVSNFFSNFSAIGVANSSVVSDNFPKSESSEHQKNDLKWRVENSEYQIEQLLQRIAELERKF